MHHNIGQELVASVFQRTSGKTITKMIIHQKTPVLSEKFSNEIRTVTVTTLAILFLAGLTHSNPIEPESAEDQPQEQLRPQFIPTELIGRYYGNPYIESGSSNVAKRNPILAQLAQNPIDEEKQLPRYIEKRSHYPGSYWQLLKALEEEMALEAMARGDSGAEEPIAAGVESQNGVHQVDKRRRRYGFWVTAINKMDNGHLKGFLGKHRNIYNVYKRQAHLPHQVVRSL